MKMLKASLGICKENRRYVINFETKDETEPVFPKRCFSTGNLQELRDSIINNIRINKYGGLSLEPLTGEGMFPRVDPLTEKEISSLEDNVEADASKKGLDLTIMRYSVKKGYN